MTLDEFRQLALALPNVRLVNQLGNLTLMVGDKAFGRLGMPDPGSVILRLTPEEQAKARSTAPLVFSPQAGGPGARGHTCARLASATPALVLPFLRAAANRAGRGHRTVLPSR